MIMNKVYKLVWSKVRNCYVVASELAKNHSKSKSGRTAIIGGILATAVLGLLPVDMVSAAIPAANQPLINGSGAGPSAVAITLGDNTTGVFEVTAGNHSFALGSGAVASGWLDMAMGDGTKASGGYSLATGVRTEASGAISTAMGKETKATGSNATAMGWKSEATSDEAFAVGYQAKANGQWSVAMGLNAEATTEGAIAIGASTEAGYHGFSGGSYSKALGMGSVALGGGKTEHDAQFSFAVGRDAVAKLTNSVALGGGSVAKRAKGKVGYDPLNSTMSAFNRDNHNADTTGVWKSTENAIAVGDPDNKITRQITGVAAGSEDTDAVNLAQAKALGPHYYSVGGGITGDSWHDTERGEGSNYNNDGATGIYSLAAGIKAKAEKIKATAIGYGAHASGESSIAIGSSTTHEDFGTNAFIGNIAAPEATSQGAIAIGSGTVASGWFSTAIGEGNKATGNSSAVLGGADNTASDLNAVVLGGAGNMASGVFSIAAGSNSVASGSESIAMGRHSEAHASDSFAAVGGKVMEEAQNGIAFGRGAITSVKDGVALGSQSLSRREAGTAGYDPFGKDHSDDMTGAWKSTGGDVSVGYAHYVLDGPRPLTRQITGVAAGSEDTDAVNVAQLKALSQDLQTDVANGKTHYYSVRSSAQDADSNYNNDGAKGENALAAGSYATAQKESVAIGYKAQAQDARSVVIGIAAKTMDTTDGGNISIGYGSQAGQKVDSGSSGLAAAVGMNAKATGWGSSAYGTEAKAQNSWSTAVGDWAQANTTKGRGGTAIGTTAKADDDYATAVGLGAEATAVNSTALGMQAKATQKDSVALGAGSVDRAATKETKGTIALSDGTIRDYGNFAGSNPIGVVSVGAKDKERQIINVAAGKISADSTDAVNGSQLYSLAGEVGKNAEAIAKNTQDISNIKNNITNLTTEAGKHTTVKAGTNKNLTVTEGTNTEGGKEYTVDLSDKLTIGKAGADGKDGHMGINGKDGVSGVGIDGKDGISVKGDKGEVGINGNDGISIKGKDGKDAVSINGKDGVGHIGLTGPAGTNGKDGTNAVDISVKNGYDGADGTKGSSGVDGKDGITRIVYEDKTGEHQVATLDDGMKYGGDTGDVIKKKLNNQVNVIGGISDTNKLTATDNIGVVSDGADNLKVRLAKNLDLGNDGSVKTGDTTINNNGVTINNGPSITKDGIDAGGKTITNIGNGTNATDAVNKGQLDEAVQNTNREVGHVANALNRLDSRVNKVGANAAALAALHPQDFDPDDKWDFAAGYGNYKDAHAIAVGAFYRPNEDTMLSVSGSFGGGENMVNAGITFKLGQKNSVGRSKVAMAKEIIDLKTEVQLLKNQNQTILKALHATGAQEASTMGVTFSDVPQGHWAYTYVKFLADKGYLKGYPDGEFKGDHDMSRYEYAAIIYRALQNGAPLDGNMVQSMKEFKPEIEAAREAYRFRVDRISGKDNNRHKVERVRVNSADNKSEKDFRDVYGSQIVK